MMRRGASVSFLFYLATAFGAITNVRVMGVTSTQAVIAYTTPNLAACTVELYDGSGYRFSGLHVTGATNLTPIEVTTGAQHTLATGDKVYISDVGGNLAANGYWTITVTGVSTFTLDTSAGSGVYTSGGSVAVVVHDVNTRLFAGSNLDSRAGNLTRLRERVVVVGKRAAELALDGWRKSRALQADTEHSYRLVCGADTATGSFRTPTVAMGQAYNDPIPPDAAHPGDVAWPDFDWNQTGTALYSNSQFTVVDPQTGSLARLLTIPKYLLLTTVAPGYAIDRGGGGGAWVNPLNVLLDDANSATYTGDGASVAQPWLAVFSGLWTPVVASPGMVTDNQNGHQVKFILKGSADGGAGANSTIEYCFSIDGGFTCQSAVKEQDLTLCGGAGCTLGDDEPLFRFWQDPADRTKVLQPKWNLTGRTGTANYTAATKVVTWATGGFFNPLWSAGSRFSFTGGTEPGEYTIASVDSAKQITLLTGPVGNQAAAAYSIQNFSLMVRKKTNSAHTVSLNYLSTRYGDEPSQPHGAGSGDSGLCSFTKVARLSDGKLGYHCTFGPALTHYWIDPDTGDSTFLTRPFRAVPSYNNAQPSIAGYDPSDPDTLWSTLGFGALTGLTAYTYTGNDEDFGWVDPNNTNTAYSAVVYGEINAAVAAYMAADPTGPQFGGRVCSQLPSYWEIGAGSAYGWLWCGYKDSGGTLYVQDYSPVVAIIDYRASRAAGSVQLAGVVHPHSYYPLRYMAIHSGGVVATTPVTPYVGGQTSTPATSICTAGPLRTEIAAGSSLPATATESCPANSYGTTGACANPAGCATGCTTVEVKGEPYDPSPCQWWGRVTDPLTLTTLTNIVVAAGTATVNTTSGQTGVGRQVRVSGTGVANLDGDYTVATSGVNTFTFPTTAANGTYAVANSWVAELWGSPATVIESPFRGSAGIYGTFQNVREGDIFRVPGTLGSELVQVLTKTSATTWKVLRNVACPRVPSWNLMLESHAAGSILTGQGVHPCISEDSWAWNAAIDPRGQNWSSYSKANGRHGGYNSINDNAIFENSNLNTYDFFLGIPTIAAKLTSGADLSVAFAPKFSGSTGNMGTGTRTRHPGWASSASPATDFQAWYVGAQSAPTPTFSIVTGTLYSGLTSGIHALSRKHFPTLATCGHHPLIDVSGPSSLITGIYADRYKYCVVNVAGECVAGSNPAVANVYINCPDISRNVCVSVESDTGSNLLVDPCIFDLAPNVSHISLIHQPAESYDPGSAWVQNLGHAFSRWRAQSVFASSRLTTGGEIAYMVSRYLEGMRSEAIGYKVPAAPPRNSLNRASFIPLVVGLGQVPAMTATVIAEFGYDPNYYCTPRAEACVSVTGGASPTQVDEATPFYFSGEAFTRLACAAGCMVTLPAISQRIIYYRLKYYDAGGALLAASLPEVTIVP